MRHPGAIAVLAVALLGVWLAQRQPAPDPVETAPFGPGGAAAPAVQEAGDPATEAFARRARGEWMVISGSVDRTLSDDNDGSRHQRFILRTSPRHTVLVAHNIDLAPRLEGLREGEVLRLRGEYQWNERGGVLHWTHHDPQGRLEGGYIEWQGRRYQ